MSKQIKYDRVVGNLLAFMAKELNEPMSSDTHFNQAIFAILDDLDLETLTPLLEESPTAQDAIIEMCLLRYGDNIELVPIKYKPLMIKFFNGDLPH